jgi:hypothetical protein
LIAGFRHMQFEAQPDGLAFATTAHLLVIRRDDALLVVDDWSIPPLSQLNWLLRKPPAVRQAKDYR